MRNLFRLFPMMLLTLFTMTAEVRADHVRFVRSGFLNQVYDTISGSDEFDHSRWSLQGSGFAASGFGSDFGGEVGPPLCVFPGAQCKAGDVIDLNFSVNGGSDASLGTAAAQIDDIVCTSAEDLQQCVNTAELVLTGGQFRIPQLADPFTTTVPMSLSGNVSIFKCEVIEGVDHSPCQDIGDLLASIDLRGQGTATVTFSVFGDSYLLTEIRYTNEPIPEPTTMLLLGTGLASIAGMIRKRRQAKGE